ncbi:MAG: hypothetical protein L3J74_08700 [Bacteroidales bacterium]|nr:hypothetical protein [Bacteroidales bacterium]
MEADWLIPKLSKSELKEFGIYYNERSIFLFRLTSTVILMASIAYFYLDYLSAPNSYRLLWKLRVLGNIGIGLALFISIIKKKFFIAHFQLIVSTANFLYNIAILLMILYSKPHEMSYMNYYIGLLVIFMVAIPLRIRLVPLLINTLIITVAYIYIAVFKQNLIEKNIDIFINNMFFLITIIMAVNIAAYVLEIFI